MFNIIYVKEKGQTGKGKPERGNRKEETGKG
jgi:hypothetical protein